MAAPLAVLLLFDAIEECGFFTNIASRPFKACLFIVACWPGLFFTLRDGVVGRPIV
jgi:hypothetical protein